MSDYPISRPELMQVPPHLQHLLDRLGSGQEPLFEFFQALNNDIPHSIELIHRCLELYPSLGVGMHEKVQLFAVCLAGG